MTVDDITRKTAILTGVLFITATLAPLLSTAFVPNLFGPEDLANVWLLAANKNQVRIGALLEFTMAVAIIAIPIAVYPLLKRYNESMALGYATGRLVEGMMFIIGVICLLTLIPLSNEYVIAGVSGAAYYQALAALVLQVRSVQSIFAQFAFSLGSMMFYYILYKSRLIPRWLSGWSLIGAVLFLTSAIIAMFGFDSRSTLYLTLNAPGGLGEMVFAAWLIIKGFNPPPSTSL
jgi:hypothetical protein